MSDTGVEFNEPVENTGGGLRLRPISPPKGMYRWLITLGIAKDNTEAERFLYLIVLGAIAIGVAYPFLFG